MMLFNLLMLAAGHGFKVIRWLLKVWPALKRDPAAQQWVHDLLATPKQKSEHAVLATLVVIERVAGEAAAKAESDKRRASAQTWLTEADELRERASGLDSLERGPRRQQLLGLRNETANLTADMLTVIAPTPA